MLRRWLVFVLAAVAGAQGQVVKAVRGFPPQVSVGGSFSDFNPDYSLPRLYGFGAYADVVPLRLRHFNLGIEGELQALNLHQQAHGHERTMSIGPIVIMRNFHGTRPFGKVMYGLGSFNYPYYTSTRPAFYKDSFGIWVFGGGVDVPLWGKVSVRGAYEYQDWTHFRGAAKTFRPNGPMIGISYRIF